MKAYFNYAYNPVYDFTTGRLSCYRQLQERCVGKLELKDEDRVLCLGLGTGNEIFYILEMNRNASITGVDYSFKALRKAYKKARAWGKEIEVFTMDARCLEFTTGSFDKVLCIHVMDFVEDNEQVTSEVLRVLKDGGQFVITYPSQKEGMSLGLNLWRDIIRNNPYAGRHRAIVFLKSMAQMLAGTIYLPLFLKTRKISYSHNELQMMITRLMAGDLQIEEDSVYQDYIVYGRK
jgi:ubiquinone/menaquinone biosynthesis C-methylase UbiE